MTNFDNRAPIKADESTIFLLGNGPSLAAVDFEKLAPFSTIGMNAAYRHWQKIQWRPSHYACLDTVVGLSHKEAIAHLIQEGVITKFLLRANLVEALGDIALNPRVVNFDALKATERLLTPPTITTGSHAALWAAAEGYRKIILLGIDLRYQERVDGAARREGIELELVSKPSTNPNYYFDDYQQPGDRYNIPNPRPDLHLNAWRAAATHIQKEEAIVYNGNINSSVRCFPFVVLDDLLSKGSHIRPADEPIAMAETEQPPDLHNPSNRGRIQRLIDFVRSNWLLCFTPIAFLAFTMTAIIKTFSIDAGVTALITAICFFVGAIWLALLFTRATVIAHVNRQHDKIASLEESIRDLNRRKMTRQESK